MAKVNKTFLQNRFSTGKTAVLQRGRAFGFIMIAALGMAATVSAAGDTDLEPLRRQAAIMPSYNFQTVPPAAGQGITVAIIGEGIDRAMKDSLGERVSLESVRPDDPDPFIDPKGLGGVGSGLAGLIGALAHQARIISIKSLDAFGSGSFADIKNGINRATELKANLIVLTCSASSEDADTAAAVRNSLKQGVLVIAPAGNDASYRISFPGNVDGVVAVGATDKNDKIAAFSNYGGKILFAPGVGINAIAFGKSESKSGTAYAAGVAGGIFAILWSQKPGLTRQQLVSFVIDNAAQIEDASGGQARRIDAQAALNAIKKLAP